MIFVLILFLSLISKFIKVFVREQEYVHLRVFSSLRPRLKIDSINCLTL